MAYKITDACISCGSCDGQYVIDADTCLSCGACAEQCPMSAIVEA